MNRERKEHTDHTKVGDTIRHAGKKINEFSETAADRGDRLVHQGQDAVGHVQDEIEKGYDTVIKYVKKNPVKSALIAGGIGVVIGRLLKK